MWSQWLHREKVEEEEKEEQEQEQEQEKGRREVETLKEVHEGIEGVPENMRDDVSLLKLKALTGEVQRRGKKKQRGDERAIFRAEK